MLENNNDSGHGSESSSHSTPPPTPIRDTNDTQSRTESDSNLIKK